MPSDKTKYPNDWVAIAKVIKDQADWKCEKCRIQCRLPGEQFDTHKRTLTVQRAAIADKRRLIGLPAPEVIDV